MMEKILIVSILLIWICLQHGETFMQLEDCGVANVTTVEDRIIGGRETIAGEFPWQASLRFQSLFVPSVHFCGASIINQWWVLTAAHCVYRKFKRNINVVVGIHSQEEKSFSSYAVQKLLIHENFVPDYFLNDIALLRVEKPIVFGDGVNSVCLPPPAENPAGFLTASGWGSTAEGGKESTVLMTVDLPIVPQYICEYFFGREYFSRSAMICAGYPQGGRDTCQGDSGGPVVQRRNETYVQIGIVSFGVGCARPLLPGVYTRLSNYIEWIHSHAV